MPIFMDPYSALETERRKQALTGSRVDPNYYEYLGYGVTGELQKAKQISRGQAIQERGQVIQQEQFGASLSLEEEKLKTAKEQGVYLALAQAPLALASVEYLTKTPTEGGWISKGYEAGSRALGYGTPALTTSYPAVAASPEIGEAAFAASKGTSIGTTAAGGTSLMAAGGWGTVGGVAGSEIGKRIEGVPLTGGQRERSVIGGILGGAAAGAAATSWSGPGAIVGAVVGGIVGFIGKNA